MEENNYQNEIENISQRDRESVLRAYETIHSVFEDKRSYNGINAVLHFFHEKNFVDENLPLSKQLEEIEVHSQIKTRLVELEPDWYKTAVVPMLLKTSDGRHLAVIPKINGSCSYIENGKSYTVTTENAKKFMSSALSFYKSTSSKNIGFRGFVSFMIKSITLRDALTVFTACILAVTAGLMLPWANSFIFSRVVPAGDLSAIFPTAALLFSAVSVAAVMRLLQSLIIANTMQRADTYVQSGIFSRLMSLKADFFQKVKAGELSRIILEFSDLSKIISVRSISALINMVLSIVYLFQIYRYAPNLTGFVVLVSLLLIALMAFEGKISAKWMREYAQSMSKMSGFCYEMFSGIEHIKLSGAEARVMKRWSRRYADTAEHEEKPAVLEYLPVIYKVFTVLSTFVIFILGSSLAVSDYIAFAASYGAYMAALLGAGIVVQSLSQFRSSYEIIKPLLTAECEEYGGTKRKLENLRGDIRISDLNFRYKENAPYVLKRVSLNIKAGESVGIIGTSGSGKSTLVRLLLGFESFHEGSVLIDGIDIKELDLKSYRKKIGVVLQNDGLLNGNIYDNIAIGKPNAPPEEVYWAIEKAGLKDDINALPMGLYTPVSAENGTFSGGQIQRLIIARTLLTKPSLIILDEATSALDNIAQAKITKSLSELECTKIIVAHRLSTILSCDKIIVMDKGEIIQQGTFEELKNEEGLFRELIKNQEYKESEEKE